MDFARILLLSSLMLGLSACDGSQTPQPAHVVAAAPSYSDFGALRIHYNVLPTLAMNPEVASSYAVTRSANQALLVVAVRQRQGGEEMPTDGTIIATASDLSGRQQQIVMRPVRTGAYTDHVGAVQISRYDTLRFNVHIRSQNEGGNVRFERNF